jgi:antirestriction protein
MWAFLQVFFFDKYYNLNYNPIALIFSLLASALQILLNDTRNLVWLFDWFDTAISSFLLWWLVIGSQCLFNLPRGYMTNSPRVYVGTYEKYNNGSIEGAWIDLEDYRNKFEFEDACQKLHGPGEHEFMYQDHEGIPDRYVSESYLSGDVWNEWVCLDDDEKELLTVYLENVNQDGTVVGAQDAFQGKYQSEADWSAEHFESTGLLQSIPESLRSYIDYEAYARDERLNGDVMFVEVGLHNSESRKLSAEHRKKFRLVKIIVHNSNRLWPPAAAISSARLAPSWPLTSAMSG